MLDKTAYDFESLSKGNLNEIYFKREINEGVLPQGLKISGGENYECLEC